MSIRKADLRDWCANLGTSLLQARQDMERLAKRVMDLEEQAACDRENANTTDLGLGATQRRLAVLEQRGGAQTAQDAATGPSTPSPVGDYPPAAPCPPAASMGVAWGVSERAEDRLIELTREAIRDDLVGRRDARYQGRGPGQIVSRDAYAAMSKAQQCGKSETTLSDWLPLNMPK